MIYDQQNIGFDQHKCDLTNNPWGLAPKKRKNHLDLGSSSISHRNLYLEIRHSPTEDFPVVSTKPIFRYVPKAKHISFIYPYFSIKHQSTWFQPSKLHHPPFVIKHWGCNHGFQYEKWSNVMDDLVIGVASFLWTPHGENHGTKSQWSWWQWIVSSFGFKVSGPPLAGMPNPFGYQPMQLPQAGAMMESADGFFGFRSGSEATL